MTKKTSKDKGIKPIDQRDYAGLLTGVSQLLEQARHTAARSVNAILTATYWEIGRRIVEYEQRGSEKAGYGKEVIDQLASDLTNRFGRGFSRRNLFLIRSFYLTYRDRVQTPSALSQKEIRGRIRSERLAEIVQTVFALSSPLPTLEILQTLSGEFPLSWSHYVRLLTLDEPEKRDFYEEEARRTGWPVRQLDRQINSMLYERLALSDPLSYHRGLKCLVAIDLKVGKFTHGDAGQINLVFELSGGK